ncbi:MAG: hypothetical protein ABIQ88_14410 [Chitinophagaceae bacterium]
MKKLLATGEVLMIVLLAFFPLFGTFPYRINIFLSYEGAYRFYDGQLPYKDFGIPLGYMYWVVPGIFFKIFGPYMMSLVKAQVFLNIVAGLSFRSVLKSLCVNDGVRFLSVLLFIISYSFFNYWPWYNHTVIVYELVALAMLMKFIFGEGSRWRYAWLLLSGMFVFFSFFTKQDGGGLALLICLALIVYNAIYEKDWKQPLVFIAGLLATGFIMIAPFLKYKFGYWFNHGQPPHISRFSFGDIAEDFFNNSPWIRFYIFIIMLLLLARIKTIKAFWNNKQMMVFTILTLGILAEAAIFQTTSYIPADNNIFFHSFAIAFILAMLADYLPLNFVSFKTITIASLGMVLWWSNTYWKYLSKYIVKPEAAITNTDGIVNKKTYLIQKPDTSDVPMDQWRTPKLASFKKMLLPGPTVDGIERLMNMDLVKNNKNLKVLNMTELTPLAYEMKFALEKSPEYPLWFHKGVGMFQQQTDMFCDRIKNNYYDLVLFEYIPFLNNFYPFQVRDSLLQHYDRIDIFTAPRKPSVQAWIEVYVRKK